MPSLDQQARVETSRPALRPSTASAMPTKPRIGAIAIHGRSHRPTARFPPRANLGSKTADGTGRSRPPRPGRSPPRRSPATAPPAHSPPRPRSPPDFPMARARSADHTSALSDSQAALVHNKQLASDTTPASSARGGRRPRNLTAKIARIHRHQVSAGRRDAQHHVAHGPRRTAAAGQRAARRTAPSPAAAPPGRRPRAWSRYLRNADRPDDESGQHHEHRQVEAAERHRNIAAARRRRWRRRPG